MKKSLAIVTALIISTGAFAQIPNQDKQIFNHVAAGVTMGIDGIGIEVAAPLTPYIQFRAGYSLFIPTSITIKDLSKFGAPEYIEVTENGEKKQRPFAKAVPTKFGFNAGGGKLMADIFPSAQRGFHFTVGTYFGNPMMLQMDMDASKVLKEEEYASYGFLLDENDPNTNITSDWQGHIKTDVKTWAVRPYVGIGFGRPVNPEKRVCVTFDMGVMFWGSPVLQSYDYSLGDVRTVEFKPEILENSDLEELHDLAEPVKVINHVPIAPIMKLNVFIRLF